MDEREEGLQRSYDDLQEEARTTSNSLDLEVAMLRQEVENLKRELEELRQEVRRESTPVSEP